MYYINFLDKVILDSKRYLSVGAVSLSFYEYRDLFYARARLNLHMNACLPPNTILFEIYNNFFRVDNITYESKKEIEDNSHSDIWEKYRTFQYDLAVPIKLNQNNPLLGEIGYNMPLFSNINLHFNKLNLSSFKFDNTKQEDVETFVEEVDSTKLELYNFFQNKFFITPDSGKVDLKSCYNHLGFIVMKKEEIDPERPKKILMKFLSCDNVDLINGSIKINYSLLNGSINKSIAIPIDKIYKDNSGYNYILFDKKYYLDKKDNEIKGIFTNDFGHLYIDTDCDLEINIKLKIKITEHFRYLEFKDKLSFSSSSNQNLKNKLIVKSIDSKMNDFNGYEKLTSY